VISLMALIGSIPSLFSDILVSTPRASSLCFVALPDGGSNLESWQAQPFYSIFFYFKLKSIKSILFTYCSDNSL
jgi:hypothetical protein